MFQEINVLDSQTIVVSRVRYTLVSRVRYTLLFHRAPVNLSDWNLFISMALGPTKSKKEKGG